MSIQQRLPREIPAEMVSIGQALLPPDNLYRQIGERFDEWLPTEEDFGALYSSQGRGAMSPVLLTLVTIFQMLEKIPDRQAAAQVSVRLDWKFALHLPLLYPGFHFTDLYAFRRRLMEQGQERLVFDQLLARLQGAGLIKARGKMRTDSTHVIGLVNRLSQLELIRESLRAVLHKLASVALAWLEQQVPPAFREQYAQRQNDYSLSTEQIDIQLGQVAQDGFWLLAQLEREAPDWIRALPEVQVLRQVLAQQFPQGPEGGPAQKRPAGKGVIETPHDPEVQGGKRGSKQWLGYRLQVTETCEEGLPPLLTDVEATEATAYDGAQLTGIQDRLEERHLRPAEQHVDQAYISGENLARSAQRGILLVGRPQADHGAPEGYRQANFQLDWESKRAICPAGQQSVVWGESARVPPGAAPRVQIRFAAQACQACPSFGVCTSSSQGRSLSLNPYRAEIERCRAAGQTEAFRQAFRRRSPIEGTLSELVRGHGLRYARYRGSAKLRLQACFAAAAANLKRLMRWFIGQQARQVLPTAA